MGTAIAILAVAVVLAIVAFLALRSRKPEALPPEAPREQPGAKGEATRPKAAEAKPAPKAEKRAEPPKTAEPAKAEPPKKPEPAKAEPPKVEPAKAEPPKAEPAKAEPPKAEAPAKVEPPKAEPPKAEPSRPEPPPAPKHVADPKESVAALKKGLASTRGGFIARLAQLFGRKKEIDPALLDEIQAVLITADIGPRTTEKLLDQLRAKMGRSELRDEEAVWAALRAEARSVLGASSGGVRLGAKPTTILVVGVNGVGKTTTIGKLASRFKDEGRKVVLAAGDTFRAAAVLQLEVWGRKVGCDVVKGKDRADPGSVIFDAIKKAQADGVDVVIADTAGRLHTKSNLMEELKKVVRTAEKALERPVDEVLLVLDSTTGQNAIQQAQLFKEAIEVSGIVLTKLDGTAKGGVVLGIVDEHRIPVRYVGIGERVEDLREFDTDTFVTALFDNSEDASDSVQA